MRANRGECLRLLCSPLLAAFLLVLQARAVQGQELHEFHDRRFGVRLAYPARFAALPSQMPVLLILKPPESAYPVFNIIVESGSYDISEPAALQEKRIVESYRLVGFTSAEALRSQLISTAERKAFSAVLQYDAEGVRYIARVALVPAGDKHFILTYIVPAARDDRSASDEYLTLVHAFHAPAPAEPPPAGAHGRRRGLLGAAAVLAALTFAGYWLWSRRR